MTRKAGSTRRPRVPIGRPRAPSRARTRRSRRGAALIEAVVSLGVLGFGTAAILSLVTQLSQTATQSAFHSASLSVFASFSAQVRGASCDVDPTQSVFQAGTSDPGLAPGGPYSAPAAASSAIQLVGDLDSSSAVAADVARAIQGAPPMRVSYTVADSTPAAPYAGPPTLDVQVEIREIKRDATLDTATSGYWIRTYSVKKVCAQRADSVADCGTPPCGRGEFY